MANEKWSAFNSGTAVTFSTGTLVGIQGGINVNFLATSFALAANNLSDLTNADTAQANLGLGTAAPLAASNAGFAYLASVDGATVIGNLPIFSDTLGTIIDSAVKFSDATKPYVASVNGSTTIGHLPKFSDIHGTVVDSAIAFSNAALGFAATCAGTVTIGNIALFRDVNGSLEQNVAALNNVANASATPGTVRSIFGEITSTATTQTSGNLVGVRGAVNYVGASAGFLYGVQGKLVSTGTLSGSSWNAGIFGQLDISAATVNAGQLAPIWGDYGTTSGTLTDQSGLYGIAMTNTTAAVLAGQLYLYGGAQNLMLLQTNAGLSGVTYFKDAGVTAGSWGNATPPTPSKVLTISIDGTQYYLPLVAQNT